MAHLPDLNLHINTAFIWQSEKIVVLLCHKKPNKLRNINHKKIFNHV